MAKIIFLLPSYATESLGKNLKRNQKGNDGNRLRENKRNDHGEHNLWRRGRIPSQRHDAGIADCGNHNRGADRAHEHDDNNNDILHRL